MGILSSIKNKYKSKRNVLWYVNLVSVIFSIVLIQFSMKFFFADWAYLYYWYDAKLFFVPSGMILVIIFDLLSLFFGWKYINTPLAVIAAFGNLFAAYVLYIIFADWYYCVPGVTFVINIANIGVQWNARKSSGSESSLVKIAKIKYGTDYSPETIIADYRNSLADIEEKYNMGNDDRTAFEEEKSELLADTHSVLMQIVESEEVGLIDKLETIYMAKAECIISEDNYLLWKNQILKDKSMVSEVASQIKDSHEKGGLSDEELQHYIMLLKNEL